MTSAHLKQIRLDHGLTVKQLAKALGVCPEAVWRWEAGTAGISGPVAILMGMMERGQWLPIEQTQ